MATDEKIQKSTGKVSTLEIKVFVVNQLKPIGRFRVSFNVLFFWLSGVVFLDKPQIMSVSKQHCC